MATNPFLESLFLGWKQRRTELSVHPGFINLFISLGLVCPF
ncbi:hypothetical protein AM1_4719 [Acaryochloris marina MBIC11017]|uniref:Uncharacterized protein n=1 Tax=Acaryochloris marina (strain MBIC 11017) TaxID=329726 RepID=B0C1F6_ACAM1|nr:hypothetical protein AM1_4719 [Acaryochloris marina MBIC11017]